MAPPPPSLNTTDALLQTIVRLLSRDRRRKMPPWEEITYFQTPLVTVTVGGPLGKWQQLVSGNPQRVGILIAASAQANISPDPTINTSGGFFTSNATNPLDFFEARHGSLVTGPWYVANSQGNFITTVEIILREYPHA